MAYTTIDKPSDHFNTKLHSGTDSTTTITGVGFQPDMTWWKSRNNAVNHALYDAVRGGSKLLRPNQTNVEETNTAVSAFTSDGVTLTGGSAFTNASGYTYASWNWKAGTAFSNDASATGVGTIDSTASVNQTAGFSIVKYTGTGSNATVAHGLGLAPKIMFCKNLSATENWVVYVGPLGNTKRLLLDTTGAVGTDATIFNSTTPNTTIFGIGANDGANGNGHGQIAYCFAEVQGYSKIGSYVGNGNADGTFVYTGFKPAFILLKGSANTENWSMYDNKRLGYNVDNNVLYPNATDAEGTSDDIDFVSNGFKIRRATGLLNDVQNYIYMAFAESPLVASNFNPTTAR